MIKPVAAALITTLLAPLASAKPDWIWTTSNAKPDEKADFRKEITLPAGLKSAELNFTCDNGATALINGKKVLENPDWMFPTKGDVTAALHPGQNEILFEARNKGGSAAIVAILTVEDASGKKTVIETDASWQATEHGSTAWKAAVVIAEYGAGPWKDALNPANAGKKPGAKVAKGAKAKNSGPSIATAAADITVPPGFKAELLYTVPKEVEGSWVSMTVDDKGRLLCGDQYGTIYRVTPPAIGSSDKATVEKLDLGIGGAHGLLYAFNSLYVMVNEHTPLLQHFSAGLWRLKAKPDGTFEAPELLKAIKGGGEHGPHSMQVGPDGKSLYFNCGNHTDLPEVDATRQARAWDEDHILPRFWDSNGHARTRYAPGGFIIKTDPDAKKLELFCAGFRNEFDFAFDAQGEMVTYDADMEWDMGAPWYRPTRINHCVSGAEFGWRNGSGKWPAYYEDSLPAVLDIGPGSPTGVTFGTGAKFPAKYQRAFFGNDWTYGTLYAIHLEPQGASFKAVKEEFLFAKPLPLTDVVINPKDGAMYFEVGGRRTQSALYRVTYTGSESTVPVAPYELSPEMKERRELEKLHVDGTGPEAIDKAWPYLSSSDRYLRFAARVAIEKQPVKLWKERALAEKNPQALIEASIALARLGRTGVETQEKLTGAYPSSGGRILPTLPENDALQQALLAALGRLSLDKLPLDQQMELVRAYDLVFTRLGKPAANVCAQIAARLEPSYPHKDALATRELCQLLVFLDSTKVVSRTLGIMATAQDDAEALATDSLLERNAGYARAAEEVHKSRPNRQQMILMVALRNATAGWNSDLRKTYFSWFPHARTWKGGNSFKGFIENTRKEALGNFAPEAERAELDALSSKNEATYAANITPPEGPGQAYTTDSVVQLAQGHMTERNFERGKNLFSAVMCVACHHFAGDGGNIGPDITGAGNRYTLRDLVENITEPSKVISDQYGSHQVETKDGNVIVGRIIGDDGSKITMMTNPFAPSQFLTIDSANVKSKKDYPVSMMPPGLLNTLNPDELRDLLAYLLSGGNAGDKMFKK